jgi:hypothetical protein
MVADFVGWSLGLAYLAAEGPLIDIIGFDSKVIEECRPHGERALGISLLFDYSG